jgi:hypothetical protein
MDWEIVEDSRISRLPRVAQPLALVARNLRKIFLTKVLPIRQYHHRYDGMATRHNDGFRQTNAFKKAYSRGVRATGTDWGIPYRTHQCLWCSRQAQKVEGDFVELGTGRGFCMSAVLTDFTNWSGSAQYLHLFDTFASTVSDKHGKQSDAGRKSNYYAQSIDDTRRNFSEWPRVHFHQGDVMETLPRADLGPIAFLHIDLNYYEPEVFGLRRLWPRISLGGVVLLDDYAHANHVRQYEAMNDLAQEIGLNILSTPTGQGIIIK